jgi:DNA-directed RNA polymerase subunit beta
VASRSTSRERYSFANLADPLELPDLIAVQRESFEWFLNEGLAETFRDISPIKDFSEALQLELEFDPTTRTCARRRSSRWRSARRRT